MDFIKFSVIIPTFNRAQKLKVALESLLLQKFKNFEVIVCDDGSTDNTRVIVESFKDKLELTYIWDENWGGPARPRNNGIKVAKGEWICFLDSDDWWYSNKLECLYDFISNNEVDFVSHELLQNNILTGQKKILKCGPIVQNLYCDLLKHGNKFLNSGISIRKSTLLRNNIKINESRNFISVEDYDLSLQLAAYNVRFSCINLPLGEYIVESSNISNLKVHLTNLEAVLKYHVFEKQTFEPDKRKLWKEVYSRLNIQKGSFYFRNGNYFKSIIYFLIAIVNSRSNFLSYFIPKISHRS